MDYWDKILLKRAKEDLSAFKNFELTNVTDKHLVITNREGVFTMKYKKNVPSIFIERIENIAHLFKRINTKELPDFSIKLYIYDSYDYDETLSFSWAKPYNKPGVLFPCWSFDNWDKTVKEFDKHYVPPESRIDEPYFRGNNTTLSRSNFRQIIKSFYPNYVTLGNLLIKHPVTDLMKYKVCFDLPGAKPWSVRTPYIDLSGSASLRIFHYYPKWDEKPWIQFYEDPKDLRGIFIEGNYDKPLKQEQIEYVEQELPKHLKLLLGKRAQTRAEKIRERMRSLKNEHITQYLSFICNYVGERQT
jgi:hypothetical protein